MGNPSIETPARKSSTHAGMRIFRFRICRIALPVAILFAAPSAFGSETESTSRLVCRVVDAQNGKLLPCRVEVRSDDGAWHFARSASARGSVVRYDVSRSAESFEKHSTVSAHPFAFDLPPGRYTIVVERGKEYHPEALSVVVADEPVERTIHLRRWIDMAELGWYSGDTHVHRSLDELPNVMLAEDLNVALPLSYWVRDAYVPPSRGDKSVAARGELIRVDDRHVIWPMNTEYELFTVNGRRHTLGAVFVLNHRRPLQPAAPPVAPIAAAAREQGAILDLDKHSWPWSMMLVPIMNVDLFELANNHIWRTEFFFRQWTFEQLPRDWNIETDARGFTEWGWTDFGFKTYYALLNCGFRMRPSAGTASGVHPVPLGFGRVYVHLPGGFEYDRWIEGLDAGRSFVTTGPMLFAAFDGKAPGSVFEAGAPRSIRVEGSARSDAPLDRVDIVRNGEVVRTIERRGAPSEQEPSRIDFNEQINIDGTSWVAVRCFAKAPSGDRLRFAHTAPVHVEIPDRPLRPRKHETRFLIRAIETEIERNRGILADAELAEYERALSVYREFDAKADSESTPPH